MEPKKSNHQANVVRISEIKKHNNADSLEIIPVGEYQAVSRIGTFKVGDLAVYIQPDSVVPQTEPFRFIWENYQTDPDGAVPEKRRRIAAKKLRGEWSEGLLMPVSDFTVLFHESVPAEGQDVSHLIGITHYDPDRGVESTKGDNASGPRRRYPRSLKGWFFFVLHKIGFKSAGRQVQEEVGFHLPVYDVEAFKNHKHAFQDGEPVVVTEKVHGSNARFVFFEGKMFAGSRTLWKAPKSSCIWRKALEHHSWITDWCSTHPEYALYGEVTPTQKGYDYGCEGGRVKFLIFDIRKPDGTWMDRAEFDQVTWPGTAVPVLYEGPFDLEKIKSLVDGKSIVAGAKHIREGIVVKPLIERRVPGLGRVILKLVSNVFLEKDSK